MQISDKEFVKARWAVWFPFLLLEDALAELPQTKGTHKVLGVKLAIHRGDAAADDGLSAATAHSALPGVKVKRAEGTTIERHENSISEGLQAVLRRGRGAVGRIERYVKLGMVLWRKKFKLPTVKLSWFFYNSFN